MMNPNKLLMVSIALAGSSWMSLAAAAPSIGSAVGGTSHGEELTINGSGFGVKSPAKPYLWAPFDGTSNPSPLGIAQSWSTTQNMEYSADEGMSGSGGLKAANSIGVWTAAVDADGFAWNDWNRKVYLFRRVKRNFAVRDNYEVTYDFEQRGEINWKILRIWPATGGYPNFLIASSNHGITTEGVSGALAYISDGVTARGQVDVWRTDEIVFRVNTGPENADGELRYWADGKLVADVPDGRTSYRIKLRDGTQSGSSPMVRFYPVHGVKANATFPQHYRYWADDVYLDTTWARVMVGNAPTWEASSHREIQIPSAWSDSSVTITLNMTSFPKGELPYLFVVNAAGEVSNGLPLSTVPLPAPPSGIKAE